MKAHNRFSRTRRRAVGELRQRGVTLLFAIMTLLALGLAAVALVRSVDTGALVLGNLGFKQSATTVADQATQSAITWLNGNSALLDADSVANGYYATSKEGLDVTGQQSTASGRALVDWGTVSSNWGPDDCQYAGGSCGGGSKVTPITLPEIDGHRAQYVILRLCKTTGGPEASGNTCVKSQLGSATESGGRGALDPGNLRPKTVVRRPFYRIVVRVVGARNTTSFTETTVHF